MSWRLGFLVGLLSLAFTGLGVRLGYLQVERHDHYLEQADKQQQRVVELAPSRGTIYDSEGRKLAISGPADSVYAEPRRIHDAEGSPHDTAAALAAALGLTAEEQADLAERLENRTSWFTWVKRQVSPEEAERVRALELTGVGFREEAKRFYPQRELASQVVGFVGRDFSGLAGLELTYDKTVSGQGGHRVVLRDAGGRFALDPELGWGETHPGRDLRLSIDGTLQYLVERELARAVEEYGAQAASAVLMDPHTGAIRAMASYPTFDPNRVSEYAPEEHRRRLRNRVVEDVFEPGSVFKVVPVAAALGANLVDPADSFDCQMGRISVYGVTIRDHKAFGVLDLRQVMAKSSNVGAIKVGLLAGDERLHAQISSLGFGRRTGIELPGESPGLFRSQDQWQPVTKAYMSFGQGIAVTPLQLAVAYSAIANGGLVLHPYVVDATGRDGVWEEMRPEPEVLGRAMSAATARQLERLLEGVVAEGTGKRAQVPGYRVAGKTGTAQMATGHGYSRTDHAAVFTGFGPGRDPALVGVVMVDRPGFGRYHGGEVAAPVFGAIMKQALMVLGIAPEVESLDSPEGPGGRPALLAATGELLANGDALGAEYSAAPPPPPDLDLAPADSLVRAAGAGGGG